MTTLVTRLTDLATRVATECKSIRTMVNGNVADLAGLTTTSKTSLVSALNELKAGLDYAVVNAGVQIDDTSTIATNKTYSVAKIVALVNSAVNTVTNGAPTALDTLDELAAALGDDANFAATITTALGNRIRVDAAQTFTAAQKLQARQNIDAYGSVEIGNPDSNFVTSFNSGLI
jgi:hypothetical protein